MRLFLVMIAALDATWLRRCKLLKARSIDGVTFLVLSTMCYHLVGVRTYEVALEAVEVRRLVLLLACQSKWSLNLCQFPE